MQNNRYYVDLNIIYAFFDYLCPKNVLEDKNDLERRKEIVLAFVKNKARPKFIISKSVYIEWFQKMIDENWSKKVPSYNQFTKTQKFKEIITKFKKAHKWIVDDKDSIFSFDWNFKFFLAPKNQSWDHFHITMRSKKYKFLSFAKKRFVKMSPNN